MRLNYYYYYYSFARTNKQIQLNDSNELFRISSNNQGRNISIMVNVFQIYMRSQIEQQQKNNNLLKLYEQNQVLQHYCRVLTKSIHT